MSKYTVCRQEWRHFPKVLVVRNVETGEERRYVPESTSNANNVLQAVDQLRRDLSGYHGQLKAHNDLQRHCDNQRKRITELEGLYARAKAENGKLRELVRGLVYAGNPLDRAQIIENAVELLWGEDE